MATPYTDVYEYFLSKISDYSFLNMSDIDIEEDLGIYLKSSVIHFDSALSNLYDRDEELKQFNEDLSEKEKDIIASIMVVNYLKPRVVTSETYKIAMSDSDYKIYSQANHVKEMLNLYKEMRREVEVLMTKFSYSKKDLSDLA
ncbi:hypothetical protein MKY96_33165 [Paenibacillus sp. FSL R7-0302]|uniref:hypothetical protein n=1 Tax=Paenibacillus sp. FSL R7-0302 TaxID=2921681 RepID=UPI0030F69BB7